MRFSTWSLARVESDRRVHGARHNAVYDLALEQGITPREAAFRVAIRRVHSQLTAQRRLIFFSRFGEQMRVLEIGAYLAGPCDAGRHLRGRGVYEVTCVVRPRHARGARGRGAVREARGPRPEARQARRRADLPRDRDAALALVRESDVLLENLDGACSRASGSGGTRAAPSTRA